MVKPYSNIVKSKGTGGSGDLGSSIRQGAELETMRYQNQAALPTQHESDAQLFADIGKQFSAPGDRPRGGWNNLGAGIARGLEYGARSKAIGERKENYDKYENVMDYYQQANNAIVERNEWFEKREAAKRQVMPQVLAYIDNIKNLDPQSQRLLAQDILTQYGEAIGENFKLSSIDGSNPFLMTIQTDKGQQLFDIRSLFANDQSLQQAVAMKMPEYQMRLQEERDLKKRELDLKYKEFKSKNPFADTDSQNDTQAENSNFIEIDMSGLEKSARADYQKTVNKSLSQVPINQRSIETIAAMREIFNRNPDIGRSYINMLDSGDQETWGTWIAKNVFASEEERADMEMLKKLSGDLNLSTVLGVPGKSATDLLKQTIKASAPHGKLPKKAFDKIADSWEKRALENIDLALAQAQGMQRGKIIVPRGVSNNKNKNQPMDKGDQQEAPWASKWKVKS